MARAAMVKINISPLGINFLVLVKRMPNTTSSAAGKVAVTLDVQGVGAQGPGGGHDMMKMSPGMKM